MVARENAEKIELHDVLSWKNNTEDVSAEDIVVGEIPIENFRDRDQDKVEKFMSEICKKLNGNLKAQNFRSYTNCSYCPNWLI